MCPACGLCEGWSLTWVSVVTSHWRHVGVMSLRVMTRSPEEPASRSSTSSSGALLPGILRCLCVSCIGLGCYRSQALIRRDQSIHQSVLLIHLLHTTRNSSQYLYFLKRQFYFYKKCMNISQIGLTRLNSPSSCIISSSSPIMRNWNLMLFL